MGDRSEEGGITPWERDSPEDQEHLQSTDPERGGYDPYLAPWVLLQLLDLDTIKCFSP